MDNTPVTVHDLMVYSFEGYKRHEYFMHYDSPISELPFEHDSDHWDRFLSHNKFEYVNIRTWICTDTEVGLRAIFWDNDFFALTYQGSRNDDIRWFFADIDGPKKFFDEWVRHMIVNDSHAQLIPVELMDVEVHRGKKYTDESGPIRTLDWK